MAMTGLALIGFLVAHLLGNLLLYKPDGGEAFNRYALALESLGPLLYVAEVGLLVFFLGHAVLAVILTLKARKAKPIRALGAKSKGGASHWNASSSSMIVSGSVILAFLVFHIFHFKFGPGVAEGYVTTLGETEARDLYRHVVEQFKRLEIVGIYTVGLVLLGLHLRHAVWSGLQSMGWMNSQRSPKFYAISLVIALLLSVGFLLIPWYLYFLG
jgi:succinate dehydrogenase / fumarate reductase cytochrome b subunit